jgi:transketolase C-terminal domain/subunit
MDDLSVTEIAIGAAALVALIGYVFFVLRPAWTSYGRLWEKLAASFLSLYIFVTLVAVGAGIGAAIFYVYAESA